MVERLLFTGAGAGTGAGEKITRSRCRSKTDRLRNTANNLNTILSGVEWERRRKKKESGKEQQRKKLLQTVKIGRSPQKKYSPTVRSFWPTLQLQAVKMLIRHRHPLQKIPFHLETYRWIHWDRARAAARAEAGASCFFRLRLRHTGLKRGFCDRLWTENER